MNKRTQTLIEIFGWASILLICVCLCACSRKTPLENAFNGVQEAIVSIKDNLPPECQTSIVESKLSEIESKQEIAKNLCEAKIKDVQTKYERSLWLIFLLIFAFFVKFFVKK